MSRSHPSAPDPLAINAVLRAVRQAADVLCDRWTMAVLLLAFTGVSRFGDFRARTGMASRQLTQRIRTLEAQGILIRMPYSRRPLRYGSHLTTMGKALFDVMGCMVSWERQYAATAGCSAIRIAHRPCGAVSVAPELICLHCTSAVNARDVSVLQPPSARMRELPVKKANYRRTASSRGAGTVYLPLPECMEIVGDKWSIEILVIVFMRVGSFVDIQRFSGISSNVLSDRLTRLLKLGVLRQSTSDEAGRAGSYRVTEKGVAFYPILLAIQAWADEWLPDRMRSPLPLRHQPCDKPLKLAVACTTCGDTMTAETCELSIEE